MAVANAYACLSELHHYSNPQYAYPGDAGCDLPPFAPQDAPFSEAYVVTLGENLEPADFALATEKLAKYLYCNAAASAAAFFDKCRGSNETEGRLSGADPAVRTFGLCQLGLAEHDVPPAAVDGLCQALIARWQGKERQKSEARPASIADPGSLLATQSAAALSDGDLRAEVAMYAGAAGLDFDPLLARLRATATAEMGADPESYLRTALDKLTQCDQPGGGCSGGPPTARSLISRLNSFIQPEGADETHAGVCLESILEKHLKELAADQGASLRTWLLSLVNLPEYRLEGAQRAACHLVEHLRALSRQAVESMQPLTAESRGLEQTMLGERAGGPQWLRLRGRGPRRQLAVDPQLSLYFHLRIEELLRNCICRLTGLILAHVAAVDDKLRNLAADLNRLAEEFDAAAAPPGSGGTSTADAPEIGRRLVWRIVRDQHAEMVGEMESGLEDGLRRTVAATEAGDVRRTLSQALRRSALRTVLHALKKVNLRIITASDEEDPRAGPLTHGRRESGRAGALPVRRRPAAAAGRAGGPLARAAGGTAPSGRPSRAHGCGRRGRGRAAVLRSRTTAAQARGRRRARPSVPERRARFPAAHADRRAMVAALISFQLSAFSGQL